MTSADTQRLLKANDLRALGSKVAFNFEDLRHSCDRYIEQTRSQARQLLVTAQREAETVRCEAAESGRQAGLAEGLAEAEKQIEQRTEERLEQRVQERIGTVLPALEAAARSLEIEHDRWMTDWETTAIRLCIGVAEKILRTQLDIDPQRGQKLILDVLRKATGNARLQLRLNPTDLALLGDRADDVVCSVAASGDATIVEDPSISPGGCMIETRHGVIDARLETQLERIASELIQSDV